jgi:hypothetical protein
MKIISRITTLVLTLLLLFSQSTWPVNAKEQGSKPDPHFKEKAAHIDKSHRPYYNKNAVVDIYLSNGLYYSVDTTTEDVIEITPEKMDYQIDGNLSEDQLKEQAQEIVKDFLGDKVNLDKLVFTLGTKTGTFFFRWEDSAEKLDDGQSAYVQIGLSNNGDFLNFINTLSYGNDTTSQAKAHRQHIVASAPLIGPFNEIYANRNANTNTTYWQASGSMTSVTGGYFYIYPASYCTATYCSKFLYTTGSSSASSTGTWKPNANSRTQASVFIPSTHATATVTYTINGGLNASVDQNAFYNSWVAITYSTVTNGITQITLTNKATIGREVAWDEAWVYNP